MGKKHIHWDKLPLLSGYYHADFARNISWGYNLIQWISMGDGLIKSHQYPRRLSKTIEQHNINIYKIAYINIYIYTFMYIQIYNMLLLFVV